MAILPRLLPSTKAESKKAKLSSTIKDFRRRHNTSPAPYPEIVQRVQHAVEPPQRLWQRRSRQPPVAAFRGQAPLQDGRQRLGGRGSGVGGGRRAGRKEGVKERRLIIRTWNNWWVGGSVCSAVAQPEARCRHQWVQLPQARPTSSQQKSMRQANCLARSRSQAASSSCAAGRSQQSCGHSGRCESSTTQRS